MYALKEVAHGRMVDNDGVPAVPMKVQVRTRIARHFFIHSQVFASATHHRPSPAITGGHRPTTTVDFWRHF